METIRNLIGKIPWKWRLLILVAIGIAIRALIIISPLSFPSQTVATAPTNPFGMIQQSVKAISVEPFLFFFLKVKTETNDQVSKVFINNQKANRADGGFETMLTWWSIHQQKESLTVRVEDTFGNGGITPELRLSEYLPKDRLELRFQGNLWGIAENHQPWWWDWTYGTSVVSYHYGEMAETTLIGDRNWGVFALFIVVLVNVNPVRRLRSLGQKIRKFVSRVEIVD